MDLHSDSPYWLLKNGLLRCYPPLTNDLQCDVLVIGGGITGALVSHSLTAAGLDVVLVDRRDIAQGSTSATTALLQYEIDTHLIELAKLRGEAIAVKAYQLCLAAIDELAELVSTLPDDCGFQRQDSLYVASRRSDLPTLVQECELRQHYGFPVEWYEPNQIRDRFNLEALGGLFSRAGAVVDPVLLTHRILESSQTRGMRVFDRTTIKQWTLDRGELLATTEKGATVRAKTIVLACGYEAQSYLREPIVTLKSTYAFCTGPDQPNWWNESIMIWESARPYLYLRRTTDQRIIVGGEDDDFRSPALRDRRIDAKAQKLVRRFKKLFPHSEIESEYAWGGTFGETSDGLGFIGPTPEHPLCYFALGFGGNGITFSAVAADIIRDLILQRPNDSAEIFRFGR